MPQPVHHIDFSKDFPDNTLSCELLPALIRQYPNEQKFSRKKSFPVKLNGVTYEVTLSNSFAPSVNKHNEFIGQIFEHADHPSQNPYLLGKGAFGKVKVASRYFKIPQSKKITIKFAKHFASRDAGDQQFACKIFPEKFFQGNPYEAREAIELEYQIAKLLYPRTRPPIFVNQPNNATKAYLFMPKLPGEDLEKILRTQGKNPLSFTQRVEMVIATLVAIKKLHYLGYVHRDIKPANILYDEITKEAFLTDFGLSVENHAYAHPAGTQFYASPTTFDEAPIHKGLDIFSASVLAIELLEKEGHNCEALKARNEASAKLPSHDYVKLPINFNVVLKNSTDITAENRARLIQALETMGNTNYKKQRKSIDHTIQILLDLLSPDLKEWKKKQLTLIDLIDKHILRLRKEKNSIKRFFQSKNWAKEAVLLKLRYALLDPKNSKKTVETIVTEWENTQLYQRQGTLFTNKELINHHRNLWRNEKRKLLTRTEKLIEHLKAIDKPTLSGTESKTDRIMRFIERVTAGPRLIAAAITIMLGAFSWMLPFVMLARDKTLNQTSSSNQSTAKVHRGLGIPVQNTQHNPGNITSSTQTPTTGAITASPTDASSKNTLPSIRRNSI